MAEEDDAQKTEDPSDKKLQKAREKGQVAQSQEVKSWMVLIAGTFGLIFLTPYMSSQLRLTGARFIEMPHAIPADFASLRLVISDAIFDAALAVAPLLGLLMLFAIAGNVLQFGLLFAPEKIKPDWSKISPMAGLKRMFSMKSMMEFLKGILKLIIVSVVAFGMTMPMMGDIDLVAGVHIGETLDRVQALAIRLAAGSIAVMTVIAALDFAFQVYTFRKDMRMSKQEVKDEHKQSEGDPQVKAKIRSLRQQRARQRMMANVPQADVVITNPTHYAIALEYDIEEMPAPRCIAKGVDSLALKIREVAEENDVPVVENPPLARALYASVELEEEIPTEHFIAVAEVIGYVMRLKGKTVH